MGERGRQWRGGSKCSISVVGDGFGASWDFRLGFWAVTAYPFSFAYLYLYPILAQNYHGLYTG